MAEIAVARWVLSPIIKIVVDKARSSIENQYNWHKDIHRNLGKLEIALASIQTVVDAAERQESLGASQEQLLSQLKDAVYEADDLLDEYEYRRLEKQAMEASGMMSRRASSFLKFAKLLIGQDELPRKLKEILSKLDSVKEGANIFNAQLGGPTKTSETEQGVIRRYRDSSSFQTSEILGRDTEKEELISLLHKITDEPISNYTNIPIITIVGLGGIGKTTLAQYVYNDRRTKGLFDLMMWICVSDNFDEMTLTRKILECASRSSEKHKDTDNLNILKENLKKELESKKFLLVLDDVWIDEKRGQNEDGTIWKKILAPMKDGTRGSKILVTTREARVATILGTTNSIYLNGLNDKENWSIVKMNAFGNKDNHQELEEIGMKIIKKLQGSPLAACVVGAMLKNKLDPEEWSQILKIKSLKGVMSVLRLSYESLDPELKPCFAYCSIFPKDSKFRPEKLVLLWIAQGYVNRPRGDGRSLMDIGMDYFNQLLSRSFFQKSEQASSKCYIMHDIIHDLAQNVSSDECFRIDGGKQWEIHQTIRHLGVNISSKEELEVVVLDLLEKMNNIKNLRSLIFFGWAHLDSTSHQILKDMLKKLRSLRVLDLYGLRMKIFQGELSHLRHLRYLDLGYYNREKLPESADRLYHLQVLGVSYLQVNAGKKKNRRVGALQAVKVVFPEHLRINNLQYCRGREEALQADLGSKHCLNWLELEWDSSGSIIGHDADAEVAEALKPHPNLRYLTIKGFRGSRLPSWLEHQPLLRRLEVSKCPNLTSFPLFPRTPRDIFLPAAGSISLLKLESTRPETGFVLTICNIPKSDRDFLHDHQLRAIHELCIKDDKEAATLKKLSIKWCPELLMSKDKMFRSLMIDDFPDRDSWLSECLQGGLTFLSNLKIDSCTGLTSLPSAEVLQNLTALQVLEISYCEDLTSLGGLRALTALKRLEIRRCPGLLTLEKDGRGVLPSSLHSLLIYHCPVTERWLSKCLQGGHTSLSKLSIDRCTGLTSLPSVEVLQSLTALQVLEICRCEDLTSLGGLHALTALKHLQVEDCPNMKSLPEDAMPASIEHLILQGCDPALQQRIYDKKGPDWEKVAHIPRVSI